MFVGFIILDSNMRYRLIILFVTLLMSIFGLEALQAQTLVIWQKDGSKVSYNLDEQPKTTFTTEYLVITTTTRSVNYPLSKIQRYTYEGGSLSVHDVEVKGISVTQKEDEIIVDGLPAGKSASIFAVDGKLLLSKRSDGTSRLTLSLSKFPSGVYIVKAESVTYKITKR